MQLSKVANDLVIELGGSDQLTLVNWYNTPTGYQSVTHLQFIAEAMPDFNETSSNSWYNQRVQQFDFAGIVEDFDLARGDADLLHWDALESLLDNYFTGSDSEALGGDIAYQYGANKVADGLTQSLAQQTISDPLFGEQAQELQTLLNLQDNQSAASLIYI